MKKLVFALVALFIATASASAMSYEQARNEALFLTDKMAYELNLTEDQYEAAYEINLDYLMNVNTVSDLYGAYWTHRNLDLSYVLLDWQYRAFCDATYFYRPIYWGGGYWHFGIYARYPVRDYFYFGHPHFYAVYRGGHSWRMNGGRSWYHGRRDWGRPDYGPAVGMRDGYKRGDYRNGFDNNRNRSFGNLDRTGNANGRTFGNGSSNAGAGAFGSRTQSNGNRSFGSQSQNQNHNTRTFGNHSTTTMPQSSTRTTVVRPSTSFGNSTMQSTPRTMNRGSFERTAPSTRMSTGVPSGNSSFGAPRSSSSNSFGGGNTRSFGGSGSFGGGARSGGGSRSFGGGGSSHGSFGGHR